LQAPLEVAQLRGREFLIEDHGFDLLGFDARPEFFDLAGAEQGSGIERRAGLGNAAHHLRSGALGERG
jgi:hypothetical protein